jgi:hypothetical protein
MTSKLINSFIVLTSLVTAGSVLLHDTRIDKVAVVALPSNSSFGEAGNKVISFGDTHTHVERVSFSQTLHELSSSVPRIQPRNDDKKHLLQTRATRGHHAFDNYNLPIV